MRENVLHVRNLSAGKYKKYAKKKIYKRSRLYIYCRFIILLNRSISVNKRYEEAGVREIMTPRVTRDTVILREGSRNQTSRINATIEGGMLLTKGYLIFRPEDAFIVKFDGVVKTNQNRAPVLSGFILLSFLPLLFITSAIALANPIFFPSARSNLTSIKSREPSYQFSARLMTKRRIDLAISAPSRLSINSGPLPFFHLPAERERALRDPHEIATFYRDARALQVSGPLRNGYGSVFPPTSSPFFLRRRRSPRGLPPVAPLL